MGKISRLIIVLLSLALALWGLYPSIWWYFISTEEQQQFANMTRATLAEELRLQSEKDMFEFQKLSSKDQDALAENILPPELSYILTVAKRYQKKYRDIEKPDTWSLAAIGLLFGGDKDSKELMRSSLEDYLLEQILVYRSRKNRSLRLGLDLNGGQSVTVRPNSAEFEAEIAQMQAESIGQSRQNIEQYLRERIITSLQNRVDQFGLTEPDIFLYQDGRIEIVIPSQNKNQNSTDTGVIDSLLQVKGSLEFHLVNEPDTDKLSSHLNANPSESRELSETGELKNYNLAAGQVIRGFYEKDKFGMDRLRGYLVLESDVLLDGENITNAQMAKNRVGQWEINYNLNQDGAAKQQKIFTNNSGRLMAIVLDKRVFSYARISENVGSGSYSGGRIKGRFSDQEAKNLVNVLNSGNLPVSLDIDSQRVVGASLGEQSIRSGLIGIAVGLLVVILFMAIYYRSAGLVADLALILNLLFLVAILATMNSTLTLTGIAGIILTIGMSVDANVIIYERIKEELLSVKSRRAAIEVGFSRAFWTIIDSNLTTGIAAICLALFGNGGVQGFAITLAWGIVCSLFTALFVVRLIFDFNTDVLKISKLAIMWRRVDSQQEFRGF